MKRIVCAPIELLCLLFAFMLLAVSLCACSSNAADESNGIPRITIYVDENAQSIADAAAADKKHEYGTIDEMNASEDHSVRAIGSVKIEVPNGYVSDYGSASAPDEPVELKYIRGRGNTTWQSDKKPYKIEFTDKHDLFGMGESKEWGLIANANEFDPSLLHNRVAYWLADAIGVPYTPQLIPVDVEVIGLDGETETSRVKLGSYYLCELVDIEESRLAIDKLKDDVASANPADDPNITGGYLLSLYAEFQNADEPESTVFTTDSGIELINDTPEFESEDLTEGQSAQRAYIRDYVSKIDDLIMGEGAIDADRHDALAELLDLKSTADYWWVMEFSANGDAYGTDSNYFFKPRNGKLYWGPIWDADRAFMVGGASVIGAAYGFNNTKMSWLDKLREDDPQFVELLKERWNDPDTGMNAKLVELTREGGVLDGYYDDLCASWVENANIWKLEDEDPPTAEDFKGRVEKLRSWIENRRQWINEHLDEVGDAHITISFEADSQVVEERSVRANYYESDPPDAPKKDGYLFLRWVNKETGEEVGEEELMKDTVYVAKYLEESERDPKAVFFARNEVWVDSIMEHVYSFDNWYGTIHEEAIVDKEIWASSNDDVAVVDGDWINLVGIGESIITLTLDNGLSASYKLHVYDENETPAINPTDVEVSSMTLKVGEFGQVPFKLLPSDVPLNGVQIAYEIEDLSIVEMANEDVGVIKALKSGTTNVWLTVSSESDKNPETLARSACKVTVVGD